MQNESNSSQFSAFLEGLNECRQFQGDVPAFWLKFAGALGAFPGASGIRVMARTAGTWKVLAAHPVGHAAAHALTQEEFEGLCEEASSQGFTQRTLAQRKLEHLILLRLNTGEDLLEVYAEIVLPEEPLHSRDSLSGVFSMAIDAPRAFERNIREAKIQRRLDDTTRALEVLAAINARKDFIPAAMTLVNETATRFNATRVTLGWVESYYVKIVAMSGTDQFERKVEVLQRLEAAMEECRDQEEEILFPVLEGSDVVARAHEAYLQESHVGVVISIPLRVDGEVCAVLTLEREQGAFTLDEALGLRVIADQSAPILKALKKQSRWVGRRWADSLRELAAKAIGPRHTWMKIGAIATTVFLIFALFVPYTYRVKANFIIVPDRLALLPVPFPGYIDDVYHRPGDIVEAGAVLLTMDDGELLVEKVRAMADIRRYRAEAEQAEASGDMGNFRVANELAGQAAARLELAQYRLDRATIRAPFNGVLVEGDLRERIGAPVDQGEVLMKFSRLDGLTVEIELPERDIDLLDGSEQGQIAFASRPDLKFPIVIERIEPSATAGQGSNFFVVRAELFNEQVEWLRPGMTGVAKLDGGKRTLAWRASHRLVDFLRMFFWI